ncbi:hypothetical protein SAPIO_CDS6838 [Scedosporium apiospermum]|uniref:Aminoglycoside phosphotransferase domain-containing protein n=1 Tax=Pseudallescheria apiosperma TaxID=563466 RepID=A0A084G2W5_PSEDA|nr:uncharacterized protein SAPIO_CDS6838 [Scedosporium apiospermum]KEZ41677.1 hypothetical protein SAPIO_CDS6838 [Scedosporium apiospermum]
MDSGEQKQPSWRIKFQLGWSMVTADATFADKSGLHPNVLLLTICPSLLKRIASPILPYLPETIQSIAKAIWPGLFLPSQVILKKLKPDWDEEFDHEKTTYEALDTLQGDVLPQLFGEAQFEGTRALILSYVAGVSCDKVTHFEVEDFQQMLEQAFLPLQRLGYVHDDPRLDNYLLVEDRKIVVLDLEHLCEDDMDTVDFTAGTILEMLMLWYKRHKEAVETGNIR